MVLVALDHPLHAVDQRRLPSRIVRRIAPPPERLEAVRLEVALVDHVEPVLVAELQKARVRRIVRRSHRVDVVRLHELDVAAHHILADGTPNRRIELVPVDPAQQHAVPVDQQQPVLDRHPPEPDRRHHALVRARHDHVVEPRQLRAPRLDALEQDRLAGRDVHAQLRHQHPRAGAARHIHAQPPGPRHVVVVGVDEHIVHPANRPRQQRHRPEDPGQPPHVLVLEIGPRGPLMHPHGEHVGLPRPDLDRELRRQPAPARRADLDAVQPRGEGRVHALEAQHRAAGPRRRDSERHPVVARRVLVGHERRIDRERVTHVRVGGLPVPVQLPVRRHRQRVPRRVVEVRGHEVQRTVRPQRVAERPRAVQGQRRSIAAQERPRRQQPVSRAPIFMRSHAG